MDITHQFYRNVDLVFFIYGFIYFIMGFAILVQPKKMSEYNIANILWLLGAFGITHGTYVLMDMWVIIKGKNHVIDLVRGLFLLTSYSALFEFGRRLSSLKIPDSSHWRKSIANYLGWWLLPAIILFIITSSSLSGDFWKTVNTWASYLLCLPGGILIGIGFNSYYYSEQDMLRAMKVKKYFFFAGAAFLLYGLLGGIVVPRSNFFPANIINTSSFLLTVRVPVQVFLALCAIVATWALAGMLKILNWEIRNKLQEAHAILKQKLEESEARYMEIVESSSDIIHSVDEGNIIVSSNTPGCELLEYKAGELVGHSIKTICSDETWNALEKKFKNVSREGSAFMDHAHLVKKSGEKLDVAMHSIAMFDNKRNYLGMRLIFRDITEQKKIEEAFRKSEERYRLLFKESQDAIYISTHDGTFIDINESGLELFGYSREEITKINPNQLYIEPKDRIAFQKEIEEREFVRDYPIKLRKKSGKIMDCLITASLRRSNEFQIIGYQGIIRDVTERNKMEEEIQKIDKLESVGIMAGGIAHDFNNILTTISGNLSLARVSVESDEKLTTLLADTQKACKHAKNLTNQLLSFSKGGAPIKKTTDMTEIIEDSSNFAIRGSNVKCKKAISPGLWPVEVDEGQIMQVVHNLVINAQQSMPEGGSIHISAENIAADDNDSLSLKKKDHIKITIRDGGGGIPKDHLKKIFDPFFTTKDDGTGLGLTSTYSIIKNHEGHIDVHSEIGVGTTFEIYIPASNRKFQRKYIQSLSPVKGSGHVLVMDDEENVRKSVQRMLKYLGYEVELAKNGEETIELYMNAKDSVHPFDVVIMDLTIRDGTGGKDTIRKLHEIDSGVKAIVSSGYFNDPIMADYKKYGFMGVIPKPYEIEDLSSLLESLISHSH